MFAQGYELAALQQDLCSIPFNSRIIQPHRSQTIQHRTAPTRSKQQQGNGKTLTSPRAASYSYCQRQLKRVECWTRRKLSLMLYGDAFKSTLQLSQIDDCIRVHIFISNSCGRRLWLGADACQFSPLNCQRRLGQLRVEARSIAFTRAKWTPAEQIT